ncbi:hypothetical protein BC936DRAFT_150062 [Jimgerdemannia flammicorona]|uniref:Uncharacterized protein n=2 Tax=Jimgerdemannia flammicorona TaxID=994334 RepID=A0A433DNF9_9FUNG|nr:hypothetical protein BC936DRAFT_150062 [Jimgerdemannia flammicorona]RUS34912.1 hypothetical protein BC938DRAFT_477826 [Jimgerdemannia flammicorona]
MHGGGEASHGWRLPNTSEFVEVSTLYELMLVDLGLDKIKNATHLIDIHVGLGAGAGLPDDEGEVIEKLALNDLKN